MDMIRTEYDGVDCLELWQGIIESKDLSWANKGEISEV